MVFNEYSWNHSDWFYIKSICNQFYFSTVINYIIILIIKTIWYKQPVRRRKRKRKDRDKNQKVYDDTQNYNFRLKSNIIFFSKIFLLYRVKECLFKNTFVKVGFTFDQSHTFLSVGHSRFFFYQNKSSILSHSKMILFWYLIYFNCCRITFVQT